MSRRAVLVMSWPSSTGAGVPTNVLGVGAWVGAACAVGIFSSLGRGMAVGAGDSDGPGVAVAGKGVGGGGRAVERVAESGVSDPVAQPVSKIKQQMLQRRQEHSQSLNPDLQPISHQLLFPGLAPLYDRSGAAGRT